MHQNNLASSNLKLIKIPMHHNASHIYVGEGGERTSVWHARWGGVGEPCATESGDEGS
jgi:hypothetical protein